MLPGCARPPWPAWSARTPGGAGAAGAAAGEKFAPGELHRSLLRKVKGLEAAIRLQASMFRLKPSTYLAGAVAAVESSAWRDHPARAKALLASVSAYLASLDQQVRIIDTGQDTLTGKSGPVPVSINNRLGRPVTVLLRVHAPSGRITVHPAVTTVTIGPHQQRTVVIKVRSAAAGSTVLRLSLAAPNGAPLPGTEAQLTVDATHFGTTAMIIVAIAIAVFVVTAIARAIRRGGGPRGPAVPAAVPAQVRTRTVRNPPDRPAKRIPSSPSLPVICRHPRSRMNTPAPQAGWSAPDGGRGRRRASAGITAGATRAAPALRAAA